MALRKILGSIVRYFQKGQLRSRDACGVTRVRPFLETLETREVLAAPTIVAVTPLDNAVNVSNTTTVTVQYSESMRSGGGINAADNLNNYFVLDSTGNQLALATATIGTTVFTNDTVTLTLDPGVLPLPVDSYSVFVRGDQVFESTGTTPLANTPQLISASGGRNNVSVMTVNSNGTLGTIGTYVEPNAGKQNPNPYAVAFGDFDNDGRLDLAVINSGTNILAFYLGKPDDQGGGFALDADLSIQLNAATATNKTKAIVVGDFNRSTDTLLDLAVINEDSGTMEVFINANTSAGSLAFAPSVKFTGLSNPKDIVAADFNGDTFLDIAVITNTGSQFLSLFQGDGAGGFLARIDIASGVTAPIALAVGQFIGNDTRLDIAIAGSNGISLFQNNATAGAALSSASFALQPALIYTGTGLVDIETTRLDAGTTDDLIATAASSAFGVLNNTQATWVVGSSVTITAGSAGEIAIADLDADGRTEYLVSNGGTTGQITVLEGSKSFGVVETALVGPSVIPLVAANTLRVTSSGHGLAVGDRVTLTGINGFVGTVAGEFAITARAADWFEVAVSGVTGTYTTGGTWAESRTSSSGATGAVTGAANTAQITITSAGHGLANGDQVVISGVTGNTDANGTFAIANVTATTFDLVGADGTGDPAYAGGGTWARTAGITAASNAGPITITSTAHRLVNGDQVTISGVTGNLAANGTFTVTITNANQFTLNGTTGNGAYTGGGSWVVSSRLPTYATTGGVVTVTARSHGLTTGTPVVISGAVGSPTGNGTWTIRAIDADTFQLVGAPATADYSAATYVVAGPLAVDPNGGPYATGATPTGLALADTDNDGFLDLVTADRTGNTVTLLLGKGDRTFQSATVTNVTPRTLSAMTYADLNGDGIKDIITVNAAASNRPQDSQLTVMAGNEDGTYDAPSNIPPFGTSGGSIHTITSIAAVDIDGDGKLDIVVGGRGSVAGVNSEGVLAIVRNTTATVGGITTFGATTFVKTGNRPTSITTGDYTGDGKTDLAVSHNHSGGSSARRGVSLMRNTTVGTTISFADSVELSDVAGVSASALTTLDFNRDGKLDLAVVSSAGSPASVYILQGDGTGKFTRNGQVSSGMSSLIAVQAGDFNNDGYVDIIVASNSSGATSGGVAVLINQFGSGFQAGLRTEVLPGTPLNSLVVSDLNQDGKLDVVVGTALASVKAPATLTASQISDNIFVLTGKNDGTFFEAVPYAAGGPATITTTSGTPPRTTTTYLPPTYLAIGTPAVLRITTFSTGGNTVINNFVQNGNFDAADLTGEKGNLAGWTTYKLPDVPTGSNGGWNIQKGTASPLSGTTVATNGSFQAMLDQANLQPYTGLINPNAPSTYSGSHALYQDIVIPANAVSAKLSLTLYVNSEAQFSDTTNGTQALDYRTPAPNQQVRVDILDATGNILAVTGASNVKQNLFLTSPTSSQVRSTPLTNIDLSAYIGKTIRLRIAATNNQGRLIVGVDDVRVVIKQADSTPPVFSNVKMRNPGFLINGLPTTSDPTITGTLTDNASINNLSFIAFDTNNDGFGGSDDVKTSTWDSSGNFSVTLDKLTPGLKVINIRGVDKAGNFTTVTVSFNYQELSTNEWTAVGPNGVQIDDPDIGYTALSGRITAIETDPSDPLGRTYYIGSANGGVWKTTDGGSSWTPLTDYLTDSSGNRIFPPIGALAVARTNPQIIYAGTGVADLSLESRLGSGVLKSTDGGKTWTRIGNSSTVLANSRISKIVIDGDNPNIVYAGVAYGGADGPGVYKSSDGGLTWANMMKPASMTDSTGVAVDDTVELASVTDIVIDPFNPTRLLVGLGNIGLVDASSTAGLWRSTNKGGTWDQIGGGDNTALDTPSTLPTGTSVGAVKVGMGTGRIGDERFVYALIGTVPGANTPPNVDLGGYSGLYKTSDNLLNWTRVMLRQNQSLDPLLHDFQGINLGVETSYAMTLVVDPTNANIVYIGGSRRFDDANSLTKSLIRIDTGNMRDGRADPNNPGGYISNDGDDIAKAAEALLQYTPNYYDPPPPPNTSPTTNDPYRGEGVSWYDIEQGESGGISDKRLLPPTVHVLKFDVLGRLLIGTNGGIFRAANYGVPYDYTSGGEGIIRGGVPSIPGFNITSLNGNLQIADVTSVAIDPTQLGMYYITTLGLGGAASLDPSTGKAPSLLTWYSEDLTGPTIAGVNQGIPNAGLVRVASPAPGAPPGTPATLFRLWQYTSQSALRPETSGDSGENWDALTSAGIPTSNNSAGTFAALAVNPTKTYIANQDIYTDSLLLGTNRVYLTRTSSNVWDPISPILSTTNVLTAVALAPSSVEGYYYAGLDNGQVFVAANGGGLNTTDWPDRTAGLPTGGVPISNVTIPNGTITAASIPSTNTLRITSNGHGLAVDQSVAIAGIVGMTGANGTWVITAVTPNTFDVTATGVSGTYTSGGTWARTDLLTITSSAHGVGVGNTVALAGIGGITGATGQFTVTSVTPDTFSVEATNVSGTYTSGGTWSISMPVTSIQVDPNNPNTAYVAFGDITNTTTSRLWKTTDGGLTWSNISSNLPRTPVYSIVIDRNPNLNAANGKIYVGTNTGVFVSVNEGGSWLRVGESMPTAPVVDLQQDPATGVMAAATQGRGVYILGTAAITPIADQVIDEDTTSLPIAFSLNGLGVRQDNLRVTVSSANNNLVPTTGIQVTRRAGSLIDYTLRLTPAASQFGTTTITVTATDGVRSFSTSFDLTVNQIDDPPTVSSLPATSIVKSDLTGSAQAITGATIPAPGTLRVTSVAHGLTNGAKVTVYGVGGITRQISSTATSASVVNGLVQITAANHGLTSGVAVTITGSTGGDGTYAALVTGANTFQLVGAPTGGTYTGAAFTANVSVSAEYTVANVAADTFDLAIAGVTGTYTTGGLWARSGSMTGAIAITGGIRANSVGHGLAVGNLVTLTNSGGNGTYRVTAVTANSFDLAGAPVGVPYAGAKFAALVGPVSFTVSDPDNVANNLAAGLTVTATSDNQTLIPDASIAVEGTGTARTLFYLPAANQADTANITITVTDPTGRTATSKLAIVVPDNVTTPTATDDFNRPDNVFLGSLWTERLGDLRVVSNHAVSQFNGTSIATLNGVSTRDAAISADISVIPGSGKSIGLITRYSGPGERNFYMAEVYGTGGQVTLSIYRNHQGSYSRLVSTTMANAIGTMRFETAGTSLKLFINDELKLFTTDGLLDGSGTAMVGIRANGAPGTVSLDNFNYEQITFAAAPTVPFDDNFAAAVRGQLNRDNYVENVGNVKVDTTTGNAANNTTLAIATVRGLRERDQEVTAKINIASGSGNSIGLIARYSGPGEQNFYLAEVYGRPGMAGVQVNLYLKLSGGYQLLGSTTIAGATATGTLRLEVVGASQKVFFDDGVTDKLVLFAQNGTLDGSATSSAGFRMSGIIGAVTVDDFHVDKITPTTPALPFSDTFNTATRQQLSRDYVERAGNFKVDTTAQTATNNAALAIATLNALNAANVTIKVDVNLTFGSGGSIGLLARYSGTGEGTGYLAEMYATPGQAGSVTVNLYRRSGAGLTRLATATTADNVGTLEFSINGAALTLKMDGATLLTANDTLYSTGSAGVRLSGGVGTVSIQNLNVTSP